jgi:chemotaxis methyl-accepting protein methylase
VKNVRLEFADKYFRRSGDNFLIDDQIKAQVDFSRYDLLDKDSSAPPSSIYGDFDLVMCSNVLFYYQPQYQQAILQKIFRALRPGGLLVTGEAETAIVKASGGFRQHGIPAPVFVKNLIQKPKNAIFRENEIQADFRSSE